MEPQLTVLWKSTAGVLALAVAVLFSGTFSRAWIPTAWVRFAFRMLAATTLGYLVLTIFLSCYSLEWRAFWAVHTIKTVLLGMSFAIVLLFFGTGEAYSLLQHWKKRNRDRPSLSENEAGDEEK